MAESFDHIRGSAEGNVAILLRILGALQTIANFDALYGALGGIVAFLIWLYLSSCVGVFGICFCAGRAEIREQSNCAPERPLK